MFAGRGGKAMGKKLEEAYKHSPGKAPGTDDVAGITERLQTTSIGSPSTAPLQLGCEIEAVFCPIDVAYYKTRRARLLARDIAVNHNSRITNSRDLQMESYMSMTEQDGVQSEVEGDWEDYTRWSIVPEPAIRRPRHRTNEKCRTTWSIDCCVTKC
jgi:hypothetical protein